MGFISKKEKKSMATTGSIDKDFASEIVEIFEEKLDELNVTLPGITMNEQDEDARIKGKVRNELIYEIEEFIYSNKNKLISKIA